MALWLAVVGGAIAGLHLLGHGPLSGPPPGTGWAVWLRDGDPLVGAFAVLRLACLGLAWYLAGVSVVALAGRALGHRRTMALAQALALPGTRRLLQRALGVGLATAALMGPGGSAAPRTGLPPALAGTPATAVVEALRDLGPDPASRERLRAVSPAAAPPPAAETPPPVPGAARLEAEPVWVTQPGEHFWGIAEEQLARARGRTPTPGEVAPYWEELVAANRDRLVDRSNPDLLYPGQEFVLPPLPGTADGD